MIPVEIFFEYVSPRSLEIALELFKLFDAAHDICATLHRHLTARNGWDAWIDERLRIKPKFIVLRPDRTNAKKVQIHRVTRARGREVYGIVEMDDLRNAIQTLWQDMCKKFLEEEEEKEDEEEKKKKQLTTSRSRRRTRREEKEDEQPDARPIRDRSASPDVLRQRYKSRSRSRSRSRSSSPARTVLLGSERIIVDTPPTRVKQELSAIADMSTLEKRRLRFGTNRVQSLETL
jgi:hypothetical protein